MVQCSKLCTPAELCSCAAKCPMLESHTLMMLVQMLALLTTLVMLL
jgi:hypothetical protein